ncbi:hypothetical protein SI65_06748 [Aspergillus cristatus]|uniref:Uncharacterized protein n=1 Tax=Aspergillus cristatus TaxID=573508 RepID=A0A1E3BAF9_ASPCR|nr:hypothetical protein SI65_06748 [Aspergillus cristatus]
MVFRGRGIAESSDTEMEGTPTTNGQMSESREANIYAAEAKIHGSQDAPQPRPPVRSHTSPKVNQGLRSIDSVNAGKYAEHQRLRLSCE